MRTSPVIRRAVILTSLVAASWIVSSARVAVAHGDVDQQQTVSIPPCIPISAMSASGTVAVQSFTAGADSMVGFDMQVENGTPGHEFQWAILAGECPLLTALLAQGSGEIADTGGPFVVHLDLDEVLPLVPGNKYAILIHTTDPTNLSMCGATGSFGSGGPYAGGLVYAGNNMDVCLQGYTDTDAYFVTYSEEPASTTTTTMEESTTTTLPPSEVCPEFPSPDCVAAAASQLMVKDKAGEEGDLIKWKLKDVGELTQMALGNPATTRTYAMCIYDRTFGTPFLAASLVIDPNSAWTSTDPKGFKYSDSTGAEDGVAKALLKTGPDGKSLVSLLARGANIPMPTAFSATELFDADTVVTVQLVNDETSVCWSAGFAAAKTNTPAMYKAKTP